MATKTKKEKTKKEIQIGAEVFIVPMNIERIRVRLEGITPLLVDNFPQEVKDEILEKQKGKKTFSKKIRDIDKEILQAKYFTKKGEEGIPKAAFKSGMIAACQFVLPTTISAGLFKRIVRGITIIGDDSIVPLKYREKDTLQHTVRPNTKFSPRYYGWSCVIEMEFESNNISSSDVVNLLNYAGRYCGIGAWAPRAKCGGNYGKYKVSEKEI